MHALETKHFGMNRVGIAVLVVAALAASIIGAITVYDMTRGSENSGDNALANTQRSGQLQTTRFVEDNVWEYVGAVDRLSVEEMQFIEQNSFDYGFVPATKHLRFMDTADWTYLQSTRPDPREDTTIPQDYRFIEENIWEIMPALPQVEHDERNY